MRIKYSCPLTRWSARVALASLVAIFLWPASPAWSDVRTKPEQIRPGGIRVTGLRRQEDLFSYVRRNNKGRFSQRLYQQVMGAASAFKEGDQLQGLNAADVQSRKNARRLLSHTRIGDIHQQPLFRDELQQQIWKSVDQKALHMVKGWTLGQLRGFLLSRPEKEIKAIMGGLNSDVIGAVVKLMSNKELTRVSAKVFNVLPNSKIGAKGYMGARVQPNSPTDNPHDIRWQVFNAWAFGVGDVMLGNNPAASDKKTISRTEKTLRQLLGTFKLKKVMPWSVLSHIDIQAQVEKDNPGSTALHFQSVAGVQSALKTFDTSTEALMGHAGARKGQYALYLEAGQGADASNGHAHGFDMGIHESRKYGLARSLKQRVATVKPGGKPWMVVNDVAGFIGPEVFRTKKQLVRVALEDLVMGKLHGLTMGLDVCATTHMDISLKDLQWTQQRLMPANPAFLMALPTNNDPMLSYLTTAYKDHVRVRKDFGFKVNDKMWSFFTDTLKVVKKDGTPTKHFGDPVWVYYKYMRAEGDRRSRAEIMAEGKSMAAAVQKRGVPLAMGHGKKPWHHTPRLARKINRMVKHAKECQYSRLSREFITTIPDAVTLASSATDRDHYLNQPDSGVQLSTAASRTIRSLRRRRGETPDVQIVISDGLNARAIMDEGHLAPYLTALRRQLAAQGVTVARENLVVKNGRVRTGYRIGELLFGEDSSSSNPRTVVHVIGERPGTGHHNFSSYIATATARGWRRSAAAYRRGEMEGQIDHDDTLLVSGISDTAMTPDTAARQTATYLGEQRSGVH